MENPTDVIIVNQPNVILITVDQLRFPMHLPPEHLSKPDVKLDLDTFVATYMPNVSKYLWEKGVKFSNYYTAASDCTAARATIHTGLYAYQTYSMLTLITFPPAKPTQPVLGTEFPTIGKLMNKLGYATPYFGKWHLSYDVANLTDYGYDSYTPNQDYVGYAGEGQGTDDCPAYEAAHWVNDFVANQKSKARTDPAFVAQPFFLTLNFVNPHDKQWYWGGMEADKFYDVYKSVKQQYDTEFPPGPYIKISPQNEPPHVYPTSVDLNALQDAIPNWQDQTALNVKPKAQTVVKEVFQYQMGGIYEQDQVNNQHYVPVDSPAGFYYADAPAHSPDHKAIAPFTYWSRALDSYVQLMTMVDNSIGKFMESIPEEVRENAVFIFTSDHGEYGSSHGLQGKGGTVYDEGIRVPLIVRDSRQTYSYAKDIEVLRKQLTSSVDLLPMIVTIGNSGSTDWMTGNEYQQLYGGGKRCDLLSILGKYDAKGRPYALHTTDEFVPYIYNFNGAPLHVIGLIQMVDPNNPEAGKTKLGVYTNWIEYSSSPDQATVINPQIFVNPPPNEPKPRYLEFYDQNQFNPVTQEPLEKESFPESPQALNANEFLFNTLLSRDLQATLPTPALVEAQKAAYRQLMEYMQEVNDIASGTIPKTQKTDASATREDVEVLAVRARAF